jgi:hypothetical protein
MSELNGQTTPPPAPAEKTTPPPTPGKVVYRVRCNTILCPPWSVSLSWEPDDGEPRFTVWLAYLPLLKKMTKEETFAMWEKLREDHGIARSLGITRSNEVRLLDLLEDALQGALSHEPCAPSGDYLVRNIDCGNWSHRKLEDTPD